MQQLGIQDTQVGDLTWWSYQDYCLRNIGAISIELIAVFKLFKEEIIVSNRI